MRAKKATKFAILILCLVALCFTSVAILFDRTQNKDFSAQYQAVSIDASTNTVTMYQIASFLMDKEEHYPLSDEFIERYQQSGGGYIDNAKKAGLVVDKTQHEPNQKWHFFDSWLFASIEDGTLSWDDSAQSRVYSKLLCPELLLWIYEACGVDPNKVRAAKEVAEAGKASGKATTSIAKDMRGCVSWEDFNVTTDQKMALSVALPETLEIEIGAPDTILSAVAAPEEITDNATWSIVDGAGIISLVGDGDQVGVRAIKEGTAVVKVSYNKYVEAQCTVTVTESSEPHIVGLPTAIDLDVGSTVNLTPVLSKGSGTFGYSISGEAATVSTMGVVSGLSEGTATVTVSCAELSLSQTVKVEVCNHGTQTTPLSVQQAIELAQKVCTYDGDSTSQTVFVQGVASTADAAGAFVLTDLTNNSCNIAISASINAQNVAAVAQNDTLIVVGYIKLDGSLQFATVDGTPVEVVDNVRGNSTVCLGEHSHATIKVGGVEMTTSQTVKNGTTFTFTVEPETDYSVTGVTVNGETIVAEEGNYSFQVCGDAQIAVLAKDSSLVLEYEIKYTLPGSRPISLETEESLTACFVQVVAGDGIVQSATPLSNIAAGGYGGSGDTAWSSGDMLKFGTTAATGSFTIQLNAAVVGVKITGFVGKTTCQVRVGDSESTDWTEEDNDNKTTDVVCSSMTVVGKDSVEQWQTTTIEVSFESTTSLTIATIKNGPLYITAIEFILAEE